MLKLNIGFNRKIGEANFSSRGASVNLEIEVESGVVREPDKLQAKIDYLFKLAKASVDAQLNGGEQQQQQQAAPAAASNGQANGPRGSCGNGSYGNAGAGQGSYVPGNGNGNGNGGGGGGGGGKNNGHRATEKQLNFATQLAKGIRGLGARRLDSLTGRMFGKPLGELTSLDASSLIDTLKAIKEGSVSLDAAMPEGTAA